MLNPIGFIILPFRYRFIIHSGEDGVIVEVKFYLFFFSMKIDPIDPELFLEKAVLSPLLYNVVLIIYP